MAVIKPLFKGENINYHQSQQSCLSPHFLYLQAIHSSNKQGPNSQYCDDSKGYQLCWWHLASGEEGRLAVAAQHDCAGDVNVWGLSAACGSGRSSKSPSSQQVQAVSRQLNRPGLLVGKTLMVRSEGRTWQWLANPSNIWCQGQATAGGCSCRKTVAEKPWPNLEALWGGRQSQPWWWQEGSPPCCGLIISCVGHQVE